MRFNKDQIIRHSSLLWLFPLIVRIAFEMRLDATLRRTSSGSTSATRAINVKWNYSSLFDYIANKSRHTLSRGERMRFQFYFPLQWP